jgi:hypothetical protein
MRKLHSVLMLVGIVAVALALKWSAAVHAAPAGRSGYDSELEDFWRLWESDRPSAAIRHAATTPEFQAAWQNLGQGADTFQDHAGGRSLGHSEIHRRAIGDNMAYVSFLALYDPTPLRVQMLYYRAKDKWTAISLRIDSNPARWLAEAAPAPVVDANLDEQQNQ